MGKLNISLDYLVEVLKKTRKLSGEKKNEEVLEKR